MLYSIQTSGETKLDFNCLNRETKESVANCFDEKFVCETSLKESAKSTQVGGKIFDEIAFSILAGFAAGFIIDRQVHF